MGQRSRKRRASTAARSERSAPAPGTPPAGENRAAARSGPAPGMPPAGENGAAERSAPIPGVPPAGENRAAERSGPTPGMPPAEENGAAARGDPAPAMERGYARSRARTDAVRAQLQPLAPGERPLVVTIAAILAALIAVSNLALFLAGWEVRGQDPSTSGTLIFCAIMGVAAVGMWRRKYWAVLGFEMLLGVALVGAALALLRASNLAAVALCFGVFAVCGPLFWFLIRAMARLQMPSRTR